ncbi:uncharacterized protein LOC133039242 [Cannabis sativa]|uniref:uncharacterized protein LOC133039242 n=1 Tax=Cannabis sativa TaxID=3483 RepID=UPI0029C9FD75|nr:uncharacterized protein LOC133039242 [Cannabis sativa]
MASYELLYGRKCRSSIDWDQTGERKYLGPESVQQTYEAIEKIKAKMLASQSRQKSSANPKRRDVEFQVGDHVFLRVSPMKGIKHFGKRDPAHVLSYENLELQPDMSYEEQPIQILTERIRSGKFGWGKSAYWFYNSCKIGYPNLAAGKLENLACRFASVSGF